MKYAAFFLFVFCTTVSTAVLAESSLEAELKIESAKLCAILSQSDKAGFVKMVADANQNSVQWWWDASGKGKDFPNLFGKCEFDHLDLKMSTDKSKKVFIQRFNKDGTKWSRPAPVVFEKDATGVWRITSYSL